LASSVRHIEVEHLLARSLKRSFPNPLIQLTVASYFFLVVFMASSLMAPGAALKAETSKFPTLVKDDSTVQVSAAARPTDSDEKDLLQVSPYEEEPHLLDLSTLDTANQLLAKALVCMKNLREDFASADYQQSFNWSEIIDSLRKLTAGSDIEWKEAAFYIVVFRSQIPPTTAYTDLGVLDQPAHAEAMKSGGFLKYVILVNDVVSRLIEHSGIGSENLTRMEETLQHVSGR
jgi:hypothetical protein